MKRKAPMTGKEYQDPISEREPFREYGITPVATGTLAVETPREKNRAVARVVLAAVFALFIAKPIPAAEVAPANIEMAVGESVVMVAPDVERVAVGNPAVADVVVLPDRDDQVLLNAKAVGMTTITVWDARGRRTWRAVVSHAATRLESDIIDLKNYGLTHTWYDPKESKLVTETDKASVEHLAGMLTPIIGAEHFAIDQNNNRVTLRGTQEDIAAARKAISEIDKPARQVRIEAKFLDLSQDDLKSLGVTLGAQKGNLSASADLSAGNALSVTFDTFTSLARRFNITLDMLNEMTVGKTLTNPRITALDDHMAWILVGEKYPVASRDRDGLVSYEYVNTGIVLAIRPRVGENGEITLWIKPEVSSITGWVGNPDSSGTAAPIISTREAMSELRVRDGEPIIIGGLKRSQSTVTRSKTPFMGDLPLVGNLFRKKSTTVRDSELVIVITPHLLAEGEDASVGAVPGSSEGTASLAAGSVSDFSSGR